MKSGKRCELRRSCNGSTPGDALPHQLGPCTLPLRFDQTLRSCRDLHLQICSFKPHLLVGIRYGAQESQSVSAPYSPFRTVAWCPGYACLSIGGSALLAQTRSLLKKLLYPWSASLPNRSRATRSVQNLILPSARFHISCQTLVASRAYSAFPCRTVSGISALSFAQWGAAPRARGQRSQLLSALSGLRSYLSLQPFPHQAHGSFWYTVALPLRVLNASLPSIAGANLRSSSDAHP